MSSGRPPTRGVSGEGTDSPAESLPIRCLRLFSAVMVPVDLIRGHICEVLRLVKRAVHEGKTRKSRGALVVPIVNRAWADRGAMVDDSPIGVR